MDTEIFNLWISNMEDHFGKRLKQPKFYQKELQHIPADAFEQICKNRIRNSPPNPSQFPTIQSLLEDWQGWVTTNPDRIDSRYSNCPECLGYGGYVVTGIAARTDHGNSAPATERIYISCPCRTAPEFRRYLKNPAFFTKGIQMSRLAIERAGGNILFPMLDEDDSDISVPRPTEKRDPGMKHIEHSLPKGDRD